MDTCDGGHLREMFLQAERYLRLNRETINSLNVFPVPDGDTGTNMSLTLVNATMKVREHPNPSIFEIARTIADTTLLDARGNSGVIISQFYRGFATALDGKRSANARDIAEALRVGGNSAYEIVTSPKEGTMLTVLRKAAETAFEIARAEVDVRAVFKAYLQQAEETLKETPEMLDVLCEAGVVDAGGLGVVCLFRGKERALDGELIAEDDLYSEIEEFVEKPKLDPGHEVEFGYCLEYFVAGTALSPRRIEKALEDYGDSLLVVGSEGQRILKVHLHTNDPDHVISLGRSFGEVSKVKVDDIRAQQAQFMNATAPEEKTISVVAVAAGQGLQEVLTSLGADAIVDGGQTNNPRVEDLLAAVDRTRSKHVILLPNNKNIILAATQLKSMTERDVHVIGTRSIPEGVAALLALERSDELGKNLARMEESARQTMCGYVTYATRDATIQGQEVSEGELLAFRDEEFVTSGESLVEVTTRLADALVASARDLEIVTLYRGDSVSEAEGEAIAKALLARHSELEVEVYDGRQPVHHIILSVE